MTVKRFNPEEDLAPIPFDERICLRAKEMKKSGLGWRPQIGSFVWDPHKYITAPAPFPGRIYFILSLSRFIEIFGTIEQITEKLVWLPTWHQAQLVCRQLGFAYEGVRKLGQINVASSPVEELLHIYGLIIERLKQGDQKP